MDNLLSKLTRLHIDERSFKARWPIRLLKISKDKSQILELADSIDRTS